MYRVIWVTFSGANEVLKPVLSSCMWRVILENSDAVYFRKCGMDKRGRGGRGKGEEVQVSKAENVT